MAINPTKWHWSQWIATIMYMVMIKVIFSASWIAPGVDSNIITGITTKIFIDILPVLLKLGIIASSVVAQLYVYGFYVDVTLEYVMKRVGITAGVLAGSLLLLIMFVFVLHFTILFKGMLISVGVFALYAGSIWLCYSKVEFRMVDMTDIENLEESLREQAEQLAHAEEDYDWD